jgi:hypothetical protein
MMTPAAAETVPPAAIGTCHVARIMGVTSESAHGLTDSEPDGPVGSLPRSPDLSRYLSAPAAAAVHTVPAAAAAARLA